MQTRIAKTVSELAPYYNTYQQHKGTFCASAAAGRNWSMHGQIKTSARGNMGHTVADKRVYCHEALHNRNKLQKANYKRDVENRDTDSDSDEEDEEDLAV